MTLQQIETYNVDGTKNRNTYSYISTDESLECPFCFVKIETQPMTGVFFGRDLQLFLKCKSCKNSFIGYTRPTASGDYKIVSLSKGNKKTKEFSNIIFNVSPDFTKIYGEAEFAEQEGLSEICGVGYRKALEFLIKDYLVKKLPEKETDIQKMLLGKCIEELIENPRIKEIAKRAAWLGNDETHYFKKWENKDLEDLKKLIEITVSFITMDIEADNYIQEMEET